MHPTQTVGVRSSPPTDASNNAPGLGGFGITRIRCARRLDQKNVSFLFRDWPVLDAFRKGKPLSRAVRDVPLANLISDATAQHQKKIIAVVVFVPNELAFHFDNHQIMAVNFPNRSRLPVR